MNNLDKIKKQLESIQDEINRLSDFRETPALRKFIRNLQGEASHIRKKISRLTETKDEEVILKKSRMDLANKNRSEKMKRTWRFIDSIQKNYFPEMSKKRIRSEFSKFRKGLKTDISDVVWRNPSP